MAQITLREYLQEIEDTISSGHIDDASKQCQHVLVQFPDSLEVQRLLGEVYLAQGQMEDAQQALDWILTNDPENVIAYCDRALISERLSDFDTALDCYQQAYELSRGNRDIRQQFNMLSAKAGQQGFMFSRAGLARLYMRGGLLSQAVQEWEAVLSVSPDRLDARTGLLETYWREGLYDEAEQLALETLQDVPGCVKALLLLAHIIAPKDMQQAKEYVRRAELLDPDLLMAQELFEDMMMSQTGHPFLKLLKKAPVLLESDLAPADAAFARVPTSEEAVMVPDALLQRVPTPLQNSPFEWSTLDTWSNVDEPFASPQESQQPSVEASALPTWSHDMFATNDAWTLPPQEAQEAQPQSAPPLPEQAMEPVSYNSWSQEKHDAPQEAPVWSDIGHLSSLSTDDLWKHETQSGQIENASWMSATQEEAPSVSPAWLTMLTQDEQQEQPQPSEPTPPVVQKQESPSKETPVLATSQEVVASVNETHTWHNEPQTSLNAPVENEEPFFFGPDWLKALGAAEIGASGQEKPAQQSVKPQPEVAQPTPAPVQTSVVAQSDVDVWSEPAQASPVMSERNAWTEPEQASPAMPEATHDVHAWAEPENSSLIEPTLDSYEWSKQLVPEPVRTEPSEQTLVNTLENLEQSLRSRGFVPLEPKSLSAIAQSQEQQLSETQLAPSYEQNEEPYAEKYESLYQEEQYQPSYTESPLTSALAQLGNLVSPYTQTPYVAPEPMHTEAPLEEPMWASGLRSVPAPAPVPPVVSVADDTTRQPVASVEIPAKTTFDVPYTPYVQSEPMQAFTQSSRVEPSPVFEPTPVAKQIEATPVAPTPRVDAFFESELETTMKRPAIRLQAMPPRTTTPPAYQQSGVTNGRGNDGRATTGGGKERPQSSQERLVKGYQHQLVGDYDEAMQEYRIIIKSAPELLGEIVSNVRALLNLAPKYSAGYRVLGDAYMRQGEYLQAMESYNKALTMAKKAKA